MVKSAETEIPIDTVDQSSEVRGQDRFRVKVKGILVPTDLTNEGDRAIKFGVVLASSLVDQTEPPRGKRRHSLPGATPLALVGLRKKSFSL
jgi:hypothetical protein